jgi:hypothetical protein
MRLIARSKLLGSRQPSNQDEHTTPFGTIWQFLKRANPSSAIKYSRIPERHPFEATIICMLPSMNECMYVCVHHHHHHQSYFYLNRAMHCSIGCLPISNNSNIPNTISQRPINGNCNRRLGLSVAHYSFFETIIIFFCISKLTAEYSCAFSITHCVCMSLVSLDIALCMHFCIGI